DETGTTALDYGNTPLTFTATTTGPHRFYTHLNALCDYANVSHTRAVQCGDIPDPPANDECANAIALTVGASGSCPENAVSGDMSGATGSPGSLPSCLITGLT